MEARRGSSLVDFCVLTLVALPLGLVMLLGPLLIVARGHIKLQAYALARAHLYGNDRSTCEASASWPRRVIPLSFACDHRGTIDVYGTLRLPLWERLGGDQLRFRERVQLNRGL